MSYTVLSNTWKFPFRNDILRDFPGFFFFITSKTLHKSTKSLAPQTPQETIKPPAQSRRENTAKSQRLPGQPMLVSMQQPCTKKKLLEGNNTYMKSRFSTWATMPTNTSNCFFPCLSAFHLCSIGEPTTSPYLPRWASDCGWAVCKRFRLIFL